MSIVARSAPRRLQLAPSVDATRLGWLIVAALLVGRIVLSLEQISRPGLQYDETLFVNAATLRLHGNFISHSVGGIPLMVMPYIGALKSWLYDPVFAIFGTSAATIRVPVVLITSVGLVFAYVAVRDLVNRPVAMLAFAALCFDPSIFWLTRNDVGPSAIELFLKCLALWCCARFARTRSSRWIWLLLAALVLGVFNKLNFIWVVNAAAAVSAIAMFRYRASLRAHAATVAGWVGGLAVIYAAFGSYYFGDHIGSIAAGAGAGSALGQSWHTFVTGMQAVLSGAWFYDYALGPLQPRNFVAAIVIVLFLIGALASATSRGNRSFAITGMALATVLIALQTLLTAQATAGWHYIAIYPFITIVAAYGTYGVARVVLRRNAAVYAALTCVGALVLAYDGALMGTYMNDLAAREPGTPYWSPAVYRLSDDLQRTPGRIFTADWGISNPLFALHPSQRFTEWAYALEGQSTASLRGLGRWVASVPGTKIFVTHASGKLAFPQANRNLFTAVGNRLHTVTTIAGRDREPLFVVYVYR